MNNKLIPMVMTLVVGIILTGAMLMPVLNDAAHSGAESYSNGTTYMKEATGTPEMIITNQNVIYSEGNEIDGYSYPAIVADTFYLAVNNGGNNIFWHDTASHWSAMKGANVTIDASAKTITLSDITFASSNNNLTEDTLTVSYSDYCFYRAANGSYVGLNYSSIADVRVLENSDIYAVAYSSDKYYSWINSDVSVDAVVSSIEGTITLTESTPAEFNTVTVEYFPEGSSTAITPNAFVIPAEIWTQGALNDGEISLLYVIPIMVIIALVLTSVSMITKKE